MGQNQSVKGPPFVGWRWRVGWPLIWPSISLPCQVRSFTCWWCIVHDTSISSMNIKKINSWHYYVTKLDTIKMHLFHQCILYISLWVNRTTVVWTLMGMGTQKNWWSMLQNHAPNLWVASNFDSEPSAKKERGWISRMKIWCPIPMVSHDLPFRRLVFLLGGSGSICHPIRDTLPFSAWPPTCCRPNCFWLSWKRWTTFHAVVISCQDQPKPNHYAFHGAMACLYNYPLSHSNLRIPDL